MEFQETGLRNDTNYFLAISIRRAGESKPRNGTNIMIGSPVQGLVPSYFYKKSCLIGSVCN